MNDSWQQQHVAVPQSAEMSTCEECAWQDKPCRPARTTWRRDERRRCSTSTAAPADNITNIVVTTITPPVLTTTVPSSWRRRCTNWLSSSDECRLSVRPSQPTWLWVGGPYPASSFINTIFYWNLHLFLNAKFDLVHFTNLHVIITMRLI